MEKKFAVAYTINAMLVAGSNKNIELFTELIEEQSDAMKIEIIAQLVGMVLGLIPDTDRSIEEWLIELGKITTVFEAESK